jgi:hypothetical protein
MDAQKTTVIFRRYKDGQIIALFPALKWNDTSEAITSYVHEGQHGAANYKWVIFNTRKANPSEYYDLAKELEGIGYNLRIKDHKRQPRG